MSRVRSGGHEDIRHVQVKEQWLGNSGAAIGREEITQVQGQERQLHFAGAAVKRYPTSKVRETQVRW